MKSFTEMEAWKQGIVLMQKIYEVSKNFPPDERFGLTAQIRSSSTSILANLAEGFGKYTFPDKAAKFVISRGECTETEGLLWIVKALHFIKDTDADDLLKRTQHVGRLLSGLIAATRKCAASS